MMAVSFVFFSKYAESQSKLIYKVLSHSYKVKTAPEVYEVLNMS